MKLRGNLNGLWTCMGIALNWGLLDIVAPILVIMWNDDLRPCCAAAAASSFSFVQSLWNFFITPTQ